MFIALELGSHWKGQFLTPYSASQSMAALMCYLQLSLLGCAGYMIVSNSLTQTSVSPTGSSLLITPAEGWEVWLTPMFYDEVRVYRI